MKKNYKALIKKIKDHQFRIAKERDKLRDTISEARDVWSDCDQACENLQGAIDALSKMQ